jgi:hypothetical protein
MPFPSQPHQSLYNKRWNVNHQEICMKNYWQSLWPVICSDGLRLVVLVLLKVYTTFGNKDHPIRISSTFRFGFLTLEQWFSNGAPQEVARRVANIMKVYFKNEKKPICIEIFIHSLKYINIFSILYTKWARKLLYVLLCAANQTRLRTTDLGCNVVTFLLQDGRESNA